MPLTLSGQLSQTPLTDVVSILRLQKANGTLTCKTQNMEKALYVQEGRIIFATSKDERDRLGEIMVREGKITRTQLEGALRTHRASAGVRKIGAIFVESGYVTPKELFNGLKVQVRSIIHSLFLLRDGKYHFEEKLPPDVIALPINMEDVLRDVIQQMKEET
jgi:hypothetical protein